MKFFLFKFKCTNISYRNKLATRITFRSRIETCRGLLYILYLNFFIRHMFQLYTSRTNKTTIKYNVLWKCDNWRTFKQGFFHHQHYCHSISGCSSENICCGFFVFLFLYLRNLFVLLEIMWIHRLYRPIFVHCSYFYCFFFKLRIINNYAFNCSQILGWFRFISNVSFLYV